MHELAAVYIAIGAAIVLCAAIVLRAWLRQRPSEEELEKRRRLAINQFGKMADGTILDVADASIEYSYDVRGVGYTAHQDITTLQEHLPELRLSVSRPVGIKYDPRNPANSIVLCEGWNGLRSGMPLQKKLR